MKIRNENSQTIRLSVTKDKYAPQQSNYFTVQSVDYTDKSTYTNHNYSVIQWRPQSEASDPVYNRKRKSDFFESATGLMFDYDDGFYLETVKRRLEQRRLNYAMITSKSHQKKKQGVEADRFHVILPFDTPVTDPEHYHTIQQYVHTTFFPESDPSVKDLGRYFAGSPDDAEFYSTSAGSPIPTQNILDTVQWSFDLDLSVTTGEGTSTSIRDITTKTPVHCPAPHHQDTSPSAFVNLNEDGHYFIHCSSCNCTWWSDEQPETVADRCENFWLIGDTIYELGIASSGLFQERHNKDIFFRKVQAYTTDQKNAALDFLVQQHSIPHLDTVETIGDITAEATYYEVIPEQGVIRVHIAPLAEDVQDNDFIEDWLQGMFDTEVDFVKEYLAAYAYSNFRRLPYFVLYGPRGTSKSTFAEFVGAMYPPLMSDWSGEESAFTYEMEKKLLVVDENNVNKKNQYQTLKKYGGQTHNTVNKKYLDPYRVRNNLNVIITSNDHIPMAVQREELPTDPRNNQFFVWECPQITHYDPQMLQKLKQRLGHYMRTELQDVFDQLDMSQSRYGVQVPITEYEQALFENSTNLVQDDADDLLAHLIERYQVSHLPDTHIEAALQQGYLPKKVTKGRVYQTDRAKVIKNLVQQGVIVSSKEKRPRITWNDQTKQIRSYALTHDWHERFSCDTTDDTSKKKEQKQAEKQDKNQGDIPF